MNKIKYSFPVIFIILVTFSACEKFLDKKQNQSLVVPEQVADLQAMLDDYIQINNTDISAAEVSADDYFLNESNYNSLTEYERNMYIWNKDRLFPEGNTNAWSFMYAKVYKANVVLYSLKKLQGAGTTDYNNVRGQALFLRAKCFLQIAAVWTKAYDPATSETDMGIPLRLDPDFNTKSVRASVRQTYEQIISDLKNAIPLLPAQPVHVLRSSKAAAYGMLARTYLFMREYTQAGLYADSCLQIKNTLMDYNVPIPGFFNPASTFPFTRFNPEVIYAEKMQYAAPLYYANINQELFQSYQDKDLRKTLFFKAGGLGAPAFEGDYEGSSGVFSGIATDEVYLMRAECNARAGEISAAMKDLNDLLVKRWKNDGSFVPYTALNQQDALTKILTERRKELVFRRIRWMDIKRLNKEGANITIERMINNKTYKLLPNSERYALGIPEDVIRESGISQNP